jgi:SAM-dependent methyltransferase
MRSDQDQISLGIMGDIDGWIDFNRHAAFDSPDSLKLVSPFPPPELMQNTSGLTDSRDFAAHGCDIVAALAQASPRPLSSFEHILDFGIGAGRVARMFKGFRGRYTGVDVDARHAAWISTALDHANALVSVPRLPLPFESGQFDCVISISVFTHMSEVDQFFYLSELARVTPSGAVLLLTVHGKRALVRAETEETIFAMLDVPRATIDQSRKVLGAKGFHFIRQNGHLTSDVYDYGITFISERYIRDEWSKYFDVKAVISGAIHDFQDIVVLEAR